MNGKQIGKIQSIHVGMGGYQDAMFGVSITLGSDKEAWGVGDFKGTWANGRSPDAKWSEEDRIRVYGETMQFLRQLCRDAKVDDVAKLKGVPIEADFDGNTLKSWRILTEVI